MDAFDSAGNLIATGVLSGDVCVPVTSSQLYPCLIGQTGELTSTTPIAYILVGSYSAESFITELDIPGISESAPEPSSFALFGVGLLGLGMLVLRRRRHS